MDRFGFLNWARAIEFEGGSISPVAQFEETAAIVDSYTNQDGFLYPDMSGQVILDPKTDQILEVLPKTKRLALLHRVPASHTLCLADSYTIEELRRGAGAFTMHLLGYLFGIRLQFSDWWFDGRVPIRLCAGHNITFAEATVQDLLSHSYETWKSWKDEERRLITNALYMHCRAPMYRWDWERFTIEYMVLDACWRLAELRGQIQPQTKHKDRIQELCQAFQIPFDAGLVQAIVTLRNELFHEALWDGSQPCTGVHSDTFLQPNNLRRLNQRLIPALLGYSTPYVQTCWWSMSPRVFDPPSSHSSQ